MKKLSLYIFLVLMVCNVGFAKPVLLQCIDDNPIDANEDWFNYLSLDLDKKDFSIVATIKKLKGDCALGNCEELTMHNRKLPFLSETHEYLKIGEEDVNQVTINKKTLGLVWYSYYWNELSNGTYEKVDSYGYYSCKKINKFPFK